MAEGGSRGINVEGRNKSERGQRFISWLGMACEFRVSVGVIGLRLECDIQADIIQRSSAQHAPFNSRKPDWVLCGSLSKNKNKVIQPGCCLLWEEKASLNSGFRVRSPSFPMVGLPSNHSEQTEKGR